MSDLRFWAKNGGAKVKVCQNRTFLERFLQKMVQFLVKSREIERFLTILEKGCSFSRRPVKC